MSFRSNVSSILKALITLHKLLSSLQNFSSSLPCNCTYSNLYIEDTTDIIEKVITKPYKKPIKDEPIITKKIISIIDEKVKDLHRKNLDDIINKKVNYIINENLEPTVHKNLNIILNTHLNKIVDDKLDEIIKNKIEPIIISKTTEIINEKLSILLE